MFYRGDRKALEKKKKKKAKVLFPRSRMISHTQGMDAFETGVKCTLYSSLSIEEIFPCISSKSLFDEINLSCISTLEGIK